MFTTNSQAHGVHILQKRFVKPLAGPHPHLILMAAPPQGSTGQGWKAHSTTRQQRRNSRRRSTSLETPLVEHMTCPATRPSHIWISSTMLNIILTWQVMQPNCVSQKCCGLFWEMLGVEPFQENGSTQMDSMILALQQYCLAQLLWSSC